MWGRVGGGACVGFTVVFCRIGGERVAISEVSVVDTVWQEREAEDDILITFSFFMVADIRIVYLDETEMWKEMKEV
jgi:hypothetical protein